jgi:catechol 2,3-dioxygenase-like lactoylglutathione lyase family enzyme
MSGSDLKSAFEIGGFDEAVLIVRSPEPHLACWRDAGGWVLQHQGAVDARLLRGWGLPQASGREWRLGHRNGSVGHVRLMQLANAGPQSDMRADDQCWDSGGIFDLNVRVRDVAAAAEALHALHWHGASPPIRWDFGGRVVKEWLTRGPDNVRLALIERIEPPLPEAEQPAGFGPVFNSSQIVRDMDAALHFYCDVLGFQRAVSFQTGPLPPAANVMGLPPGLATQAGLDLHILHPKGVMEGSVELVSVTGAGGLDLSDTAVLPNFGMALLRLPVRGLGLLAAHLHRTGWPLAMPPTQVSLAPHGVVDLLAVRSPEGAWLEFYESAG